MLFIRRCQPLFLKKLTYPGDNSKWACGGQPTVLHLSALTLPLLQKDDDKRISHAKTKRQAKRNQKSIAQPAQHVPLPPFVALPGLVKLQLDVGDGTSFINYSACACHYYTSRERMKPSCPSLAPQTLYPVKQRNLAANGSEIKLDSAFLHPPL